MANIDKITKIKLKAKESTSPVVPPLEPGEIRALTKSRLIGNINGGGSSGASNVSPTLNLMDFDTGESRTTITEEEKKNLDKGLYGQIVVIIPSEEDETSSTSLFPTKLFTIDQGAEKAFMFSQFKTTSDGSKISSIGLYIMQIGTKNDKNEYPVTIVANGVCDIGGASIQTIDAYLNGSEIRDGGILITDISIMDLKPPFILDIYNDLNKTKKIVSIVMTFDSSYKQGEQTYKVFFAPVQYRDTSILYLAIQYDPNRDSYIFNAFDTPIIKPHEENTSKILQSKNGEFEWVDAPSNYNVIIRRY